MTTASTLGQWAHWLAPPGRKQGGDSMSQTDISGHLIHLTKGSGPRDCVGTFWRLQSIIDDRALHGGTGYVRGKYPCLCLSEAPDA